MALAAGLTDQTWSVLAPSISSIKEKWGSKISVDCSWKCKALENSKTCFEIRYKLKQDP